ncbi:MAG: aromatic amino acid hydroxylase [Candidatus Marinimicrobia bacterium]|nr:aromatic amino acid hydroxylase [Candidatus Neomarinimicrobiota bacterium]MCF7904175.1 aromatic amino acid hydroxylase [Candidatus Neomarinimicrobiota bacterium]
MNIETKNNNKSKNPILDKLPSHLKQFISPQNYAAYSPIDQAVWRYVLRRNVKQLEHMAHPSFIDGLKQTGISIEQIPNMESMNKILSNIGWAAVAVDGFIPPTAFMEFQAFNVLVIAADIRQIEHIEYTPAPDIIHESAGHAPIIANPEYAEYLHRFGEIGSKAISSEKDYQLYEAVRHLSIIKEASGTSQEEIDAAEKDILSLQDNMGEPSEMAQIRNLHWWTVEYGLIGEGDDLRIYGAGLLSSVGESSNCLSDKVEKIPYTVAASQVNFDITKPQPQLFVTPDFAHLSLVLEEFANTMALRKGGLVSVEKVLNSKSLTTLELSTGLQISGHFSRVIAHEDKPIYIQTEGESALALRDKELVGHGKEYHAQGFGSPIGKLKGINLAIEDMSPRDLVAYNIYEGKRAELTFEGGVTVSGVVITGTRNLQGKIVLISFDECQVRYKDEILFEPDWGVYDMAVGKSVVSAFAGPADVDSFDLSTHVPSERTAATARSDKLQHLETLYAAVRNHRQSGTQGVDLKDIFQTLRQDHPEEWLLCLELHELSLEGSALKEDIYNYLNELYKVKPHLEPLIMNGLKLND